MKLIIANWKMNPATVEEAVALARATDIEGLVIAPPFPFLEAVGKELKYATLGAQDVPRDLALLDARYVIVGHSDRRKLGETDEMIAKKMKAAVDAGLIPVLCVGESREEHDAGRAREVVARELRLGLSLLTLNPERLTLNAFAVAYEPIWAISTNKNAVADTPENAVNMVVYIREQLGKLGFSKATRVLYGGSVNSKNAAGFLKEKEIDGALVGGASLKPEEIKKIVVEVEERG